MILVHFARRFDEELNGAPGSTLESQTVDVEREPEIVGGTLRLSFSHIPDEVELKLDSWVEKQTIVLPFKVLEGSPSNESYVGRKSEIVNVKSFLVVRTLTPSSGGCELAQALHCSGSQPA